MTDAKVPESNDEWVVFQRDNGDIVYRRRPPELVRSDEDCVVHSLYIDEQKQKWVCGSPGCDYTEDASRLFRD